MVACKVGRDFSFLNASSALTTVFGKKFNNNKKLSNHTAQDSHLVWMTDLLFHRFRDIFASTRERFFKLL